MGTNKTRVYDETFQEMAAVFQITTFNIASGLQDCKDRNK
jgi:hypothetical protein